MDSITLLQQYIHEDSQRAFEELVNRHTDLVYTVALRRTGSQTMARDVTQQVFSDLAHKAHTISPDAVLPGWLHRHCCFTAAKARRQEERRLVREAKAMEHLSPITPNSWKDLEPEIDDVLQSLSEPDRNAVILRYFDSCDYRSIGAALGIGEDAARKRVDRALAKLRPLLAKRGITTTTAALSVALTNHAVEAAPSGMAQAVLNSMPSTSQATIASMVPATMAIVGAFVCGVSLPLVWPTATPTEMTAARMSGFQHATQSKLQTNKLPARPTLAEVLAAEGFDQWFLLVDFMPIADIDAIKTLADSWGGYDWSPLPSSKWHLLFQRWIEIDPMGAVFKAEALDPLGHAELREQIYAAWAEHDYPAARAFAEDKPHVIQAIASSIVAHDPAGAEILRQRYPEMRDLSRAVLTEMATHHPKDALANALASPLISRAGATHVVIQTWAKTDINAATDAAKAIELPQERDAALGAVFSRLQQLDPDKALAEWAMLPQGASRRNLLFQIARHHSQRDPYKALQWGEGLENPQEQRIAMSYAVRSLVETGKGDLLPLMDHYGWDLAQSDTKFRSGVNGGNLASEAKEAIVKLAFHDRTAAMNYLEKFPAGRQRERLIKELNHGNDSL